MTSPQPKEGLAGRTTSPASDEAPGAHRPGPVEPRRPVPIVLVDRPTRPPRQISRSFLGLSWWLWALLILAFAFLAAVQIYRDAARSRWVAPPETRSELFADGPASPVRVDDLLLTWDSVPAASSYRLHITTVTGTTVIEGLHLEETNWRPPIEALPALPPGEYRWWVVAVNREDHTLARSATEAFYLR